VELEVDSERILELARGAHEVVLWSLAFAVGTNSNPRERQPRHE